MYRNWAIKASSKHALPSMPFIGCFLPLFQDESWDTTFNFGLQDDERARKAYFHMEKS